MYKKLLYVILFVNLCILTGCAKQSVQDINNTIVGTQQEETNTVIAEDAITNRKHVNEDENNNKYQSILADIDKIEIGTSAVVTAGKRTTFTVCVKETFITDNIYDFPEIMSKDNADNIYNYYTTFDKNHVLNEDGTVTLDRYGNERVFLLVKLSIKNETDNEDIFNSMGFRIFDIKSEENRLASYSYRAEGFRFIDIADDYERNNNHLTLQSGEEKEIVIGTPISTKLVKEYDCYNDEGGITHYENVITGEDALNDLYMVYCTTSNPFPQGAKVFKLNVENNEVVK